MQGFAIGRLTWINDEYSVEQSVSRHYIFYSV